MTAQTVTQAAEEQSRDLKLINWLRAQQDDLAMAAASHLKPATIVRVAQGALRKDPKLMAAAIANPQSLLYCLLDAARLGHEAGTDQYWLIPFGQEVTGIEGYKGVIERMYRAGGVSTVHAEVVYTRDVYRSMGSRMPPVHEYDEFADEADRGQLRGVYAYAMMANGPCSQVIRMGKAEVMKHKAMSRGSDRSDSPWQKWEPAMWKKCPLNALEPYVPTSSEWLMTRARAEATAQGRPVIAQGWAPPIPAAAAPRQLVAGSVEPQNVPPAAPETPSGPAVPPAEVAAAGGTRKPQPASTGQVGLIRKKFTELYPGEETEQERWERLLQTQALAKREEPLGSTKELTSEQATRVLDEFREKKISTAAQLEALLNDGTVPGE